MNNKPIYVTKPFMPPFEEYNGYIQKIYQNGILTNQGPMLKEFEGKLKNFFGVENLHYVVNGTLALQLALSALDISNAEVITTPFSYVATVSSILWQNCKPVFVDIEPGNFTINPEKIQEKITDKTAAIMPVHVFGYACDVDAIQNIADKNNLKVIYDAAHTFGSKYKGKSLVSYGDVSTCSFHATKLFHTIEGGACVVKDKKVSDKLDLQKRFGHNQDNHISLGINAKQSELNAAMGLANMKYVDDIIKDRKRICDNYDVLLNGKLQRPALQSKLEYNYAYYPVLFKSEAELLRVFDALNKENIFPRRYFYPSLNTLTYIKDKQACPVSENIALRSACLPLYHGLEEHNIERIAKIIKGSLCQR